MDQILKLGTWFRGRFLETWSDYLSFAKIGARSPQILDSEAGLSIITNSPDSFSRDASGKFSRAGYEVTAAASTRLLDRLGIRITIVET